MQLTTISAYHSLDKVKTYSPKRIVTTVHSTGSSRLMHISLLRISLLRFFKTFHENLPYAIIGYFISLVTSYSAYAATETEMLVAKIDGFLYPNFM